MKQINSVVEICTSKIVCTVVEIKGYNSSEIIGFSSVPYAGIKKGNFLNSARLESSILEAIEKAEDQAGKKIKDVYVALPGALVRVACNGADISVASQKHIIAKEDIEFLASEAQKFFVPERMQILHKSPIGFKLDDGKSTISPVGMRSTNLSGVFSFATCEKEIVNFLLDIFEHLKINIIDFVASPLTQGLMLAPSENKINMSLIVDVGYFSTDVIIMQGDGILYHTAISVGGYNITNDLCVVMNMSPNEAEQIKRRYVFGLDTSFIETKQFSRNDDGKLKVVSNASIQAIIEARAQELMMLVNKKISSLGLKFNKYTKMYVVGGGIAMMRGCRELFDSYFPFDVIMPKYENPKINTPNYYSMLSVIEFANKDRATQEVVVKKSRNKFLQKIIDFFIE